MFTLRDAEEVRIRSFIIKRLSSSSNELEARIFPPIPNQDMSIDYYRFHDVLKRYTFKKDLGGFGLKKEYSTQLNVSIPNSPELRESIMGLDNIKMYWLTGNIKQIERKNLIRMNKKKLENVDLYNYPVRIAISEEKEIKNDDFQILNDSSFPKTYRLQNRISIYSEDKLFRIDFTSLKTGDGKSLRNSQTMSSFPTHEIEIEYIGGNNISKDTIFTGFISQISRLLSVYYDSPILVTRSKEAEILDKYMLLVRKNENLRKSNRSDVKSQKGDFIAANPRTLHRENCRKDPKYPNILRNYAVTYKADGIRMLLYSHPTDEKESELYLIDNNFNILSVGNKVSEWNNSIVEGEFIKDSRSFYAYDMLYAKGLDIRNKSLESFNEKQTSRLSYLKEFVSSLNQEKSIIKIFNKPHHFGNEEQIFIKCKELWNNRNSQPFHVDGLIFTPATDSYPDKPGTWDKLFKWKPPHLNTIDFLIESEKSPNGKDKLYPFISLNTEEEKVRDTTDYGVTQYKIMKLNVSGRTEIYNRKTSTMKTGRGAVLFQEAKVPVTSEGKVMAKDPLSGSVQEILDNTIVEFSYDEKSSFPWKPIRVRHGKTEEYRKYKRNFGNDERTARDIWKSIQIPVTVKMITSGDIPAPSSENEVRYTMDQGAVETQRLAYQTFHTVYIKKKLLESVAFKDSQRGAGYLIDFGSSRGGDLNRWNEIGFTSVVGIDLDPDSVEQATIRYERMKADKDKFRVSFLCGNLTKPIFPNYEASCDSSERKIENMTWKEMMKLNIPQKYIFDVVSSQFMIHYSFSDEISLRTYLQNVTDNLKIGGYFVGTTFDGQRIYEALKRKNSISGSKGKEKIWEITKLYGVKKFVEGKPNFGIDIDVFVSSIGIPHKEYLVSYKYLEEVAEEYGLKLEEVKPFSEYWKEGVENSEIKERIKMMSEDEKKFSFFFSSFKFKKEKQPPETTYRKLVRLKNKMIKKT